MGAHGGRCAKDDDEPGLIQEAEVMRNENLGSFGHHRQQAVLIPARIAVLSHTIIERTALLSPFLRSTRCLRCCKGPRMQTTRVSKQARMRRQCSGTPGGQESGGHLVGPGPRLKRKTLEPVSPHRCGMCISESGGHAARSEKKKSSCGEE